MTLNKYLLSIAGLLIIAGCAHHRDVRPGAEGVHRVVVKSVDEEEATQSAMKQANHYCKEMADGKNAAIVEEKTKYTGSMDETTHKNIRRASKVAGAVGSGMMVFGGDNEKNAGKVATGAGVVGAAVLDEDAYTAEFRFKCM